MLNYGPLTGLAVGNQTQNLIQISKQLLSLPYVHCQANLINIYFDHTNINTYDISTIKIPWLSVASRSGQQQSLLYSQNLLTSIQVQRSIKTDFKNQVQMDRVFPCSKEQVVRAYLDTN